MRKKRGRYRKRAVPVKRTGEAPSTEQIIGLIQELKNTYTENLTSIRKELIAARVEVYQSKNRVEEKLSE